MEMLCISTKLLTEISCIRTNMHFKSCVIQYDVFCGLQGMYGIGDEVYLSLPCVLNSSGVGSVINMTLIDEEIAQLKKSADTLWGIQKDLKDL